MYAPECGILERIGEKELPNHPPGFSVMEWDAWHEVLLRNISWVIRIARARHKRLMSVIVVLLTSATISGIIRFNKTKGGINMTPMEMLILGFSLISSMFYYFSACYDNRAKETTK